MFRVWARLERHARAFLRESSLQLTGPAQLYLSWLCRKAAVNITSERLAEDPDALALAEHRVEQLLATAGGLAVAGGEDYLDHFAGLPKKGIRGRISVADLRRALRRMGPIWPFYRGKTDGLA